MIKVLKNKKQIEDSRFQLKKLGADSSTGLSRRIYQMLYFMRFRKAAEKVAVNKSWDVLTILQLIEKYKPNKDANIYDMGSYNCEIPLALWWRGYRNIMAADFNTKGRAINWYGNKIQFRQENFYKSTIPAHSLDVITALSVIEHGFEQVEFFKVCSDLLKPGGLVLITTDFHSTKIPIDPEFRIFNLSYIIFSSEEIIQLIAEAKKNGFELISEEREQNWDTSEYPIEFLEKKMSFILLGFKKNEK
ncbi:MAG: methyltransferase domain-containing protein [Bacteriovorax sp.]|nr:methyltransferase domain-containing protein [Bacteriovorax sp.]